MLDELTTSVMVMWELEPLILVGIGAMCLFVFFMMASTAATLREARLRETAGWSIPARRITMSKNKDGTVSEKLILRPSYRRNLFLVLGYFLCWGLIFATLGFAGQFGVTQPVMLAIIAVLFLISSLFAVRLLKNKRRIVVTPEKIIDRNPFRFDRTFKLANIHSLEPVEKKFQKGTKLRFEDGRALVLRASYEGYKDFLVRLSDQHPQIKKVIERARPLAPR